MSVLQAAEIQNLSGDSEIPSLHDTIEETEEK